MKTSDLDGFLMVKIEQLGYRQFLGTVHTSPGAHPLFQYVGDSRQDAVDKVFGALKAVGVKTGHMPGPKPIVGRFQDVATPRHREFQQAYADDYRKQHGQRLDKRLFNKKKDGNYRNKRIQAAWWGWFCGMEKAAAGGVA